MRRSKRLNRAATLPTVLMVVSLAGTAAGAADPVWPGPPAEPLVRLESVLGKLNNFEVAVQGPVEGRPRTFRRLGRPSGIAFDGRGRLLVSDSRQSALLQIDTDLGVVLVYGTGTAPSLREPRGVAAHPDGTIFVADAGLRQVVAFDTGGEVAAVYGHGGLEEPNDVALSPDGSRLYVADARADSIAIFDVASSQRVDGIGRRGTGLGEFHLPTAVEFDRSGSLLIVDQLNERVQRFDSNNAFDRLLELGDARGPSRPDDVAAAGSGKILVTDSARSRIQIFDSALRPLLSFGRNGLGQGEFLEVGGIAVHGDRLAVLDRAGGRVQLFRLTAEPPVAQRHARSTWPESRHEPAAGAPAPPPTSPAAAEKIAPAAVAAPEPSLPAPAVAAAEPEPEPLASGEPGPAGEPALIEEPLPAEREVSAEAARVAQELLDLIEEWAAAWSAQDVDRYLGLYSRSFQPSDGSSRAAWAAQRRSRVSGPDSIAVGIEIVETRLDESAAEITFLQSYRSDRYSDRVRKTLRLVPEDGGWKIARETVLETLD